MVSTVSLDRLRKGSVSTSVARRFRPSATARVGTPCGTLDRSASRVRGLIEMQRAAQPLGAKR
jgi:hypothetical protein